MKINREIMAALSASLKTMTLSAMDALSARLKTMTLSAMEASASPARKNMTILPVSPEGIVDDEALGKYLQDRREEVGKRLQMCLDSSSVAVEWLHALSEDDLYQDDKYMGDAATQGDTEAALQRVRSAGNPIEMVAAVEDMIMCFCGFTVMKPHKARCIINAVHFQYNVNVHRLLETSLSLPSDDGAPTAEEKALFDDAHVAAAELLLRCVVETSDGGVIANPFSPGMPMGKLLRLPLLAQLVLVLTNAVEAVWYQEALPACPMGINIYASLLVAEAPVLQMTDGVSVVEIMELTKGAKRGPEVEGCVDKLRAAGKIVLLDDFDMKHPGIDSKPDGIKVCVFANAFHSLQAFKIAPVEGSSAPLLPIEEVLHVEKERLNAFDLMDFYGSIVPKHQSGARVLVMEGSENCLKSEIPGPPFNFGEPRATVATAHVYQTAAKALCASLPEGESLQMLHQGGRALYDDEVFDADACAVIAACGKQMAAARAGDAGTMAWIGSEAVRRAAMQQRPLVCGVAQK
jgi:hypothetical protein